ncbi:MAG: adenylate/guanylate cyclase domain-containing protein [Bacteroidota bacterium]
MKLRLLLILGFSLFSFYPSLRAQDAEDYARMIDSVVQIIDTTRSDSVKYHAINEWSFYGRQLKNDSKKWATSVEPEQLRFMDSTAAYFKRKKDTINWRISLAHLSTYNYQTEDSTENFSVKTHNWIAGNYGYLLRNTHLKPDSSGEYFYYSFFAEFLVLEDSSQTLEIEDVIGPEIQQQFSGNFTYPVNFTKSPDDRVFWLKLKLRSENYRDDDYAFEIGYAEESWRKIDIYIEDSLGQYSHIISGNDLPLDEKIVPDWRNKFNVFVPKGESRIVYIRLDTPARIKKPYRIRLGQINPIKIMEDEMRTWQINGVFFGIVLIQAIFFIFLFFTTRLKYYLYYIIFLVGLALMMMVTNYLPFIFPYWKEFDFAFNIGLATLAAVGLMYFSFHFLEIGEMSPKWKTFLRILSALLIISTSFLSFFILDSAAYHYRGGESGRIDPMVSISLFFALVGLVTMVVWGILAHRRGHKTAKYLLAGLTVMLVGVGFPLLSPILKTNWTSQEEAIISSQISVIILLAFFGLAIGRQRRELEEEKRVALEDKLDLQEKINAASAKFVPFDFIRSLGKENILDVQLGDATEKEVTVFFSDIRNYTSMVEDLSPEENFRFINDFHRTIGPSITEHKGFVNQYLGDGIMAIFLQSQDHALQAAIDIQTRIRTYKPLLPGENGNMIRMGMGLHAGSLMMGIIGDDKRTDAATVSDTVNTASRMEGLTKYYGASILLSGEVKAKLSEEDNYTLRYLGKVQVKGKQNSVEVFECLNGRKPEEGEKLIESLSDFQAAVASYFDKDFKAAVELFENILSKNPGDKASRIYLEKAQQNLQTEIGEDWDGVLTMKEK